MSSRQFGALSTDGLAGLDTGDLGR
ncbi:hypothetical protein [Duganella sp. BJB1802]|nr:hypothetical protein [Duganella sp. BJB1802]